MENETTTRAKKEELLDKLYDLIFNGEEMSKEKKRYYMNNRAIPERFCHDDYYKRLKRLQNRIVLVWENVAEPEEWSMVSMGMVLEEFEDDILGGG